MSKARNFHIKLPEDGYAALEAIAADQRRDMAEVAREALEDYVRKQGHDVSFVLKKGGNRRGTKEGGD